MQLFYQNHIIKSHDNRLPIINFSKTEDATEIAIVLVILKMLATCLIKCYVINLKRPLYY